MYKINSSFHSIADRKKPPATATITTIDLSPPERNENRNTKNNCKNHYSYCYNYNSSKNNFKNGAFLFHFEADGNVAAVTTIDLSPTRPTPTEINTSLEAFTGRGYVLGSIGNNTGGGASTSSGLSIPRNLFGAASTSSSGSSSLFASSSAIGSSMKKGGAGTQPPRRGEHPLLAKWMQSKTNH